MGVRTAQVTTLDPTAVARVVTEALAEDVGAGDLTTNALFTPEARCRARLLVKEPGVVCGLPVAEAVFRALDANVRFEAIAGEGRHLRDGGEVAVVEGSARAVLTGERTALNLLGRLSGVATMARAFVDAVAGTGAVILDTRKTTPGLRALEKYATSVGGATNHRRGLHDGILVKDNHLRLTGDVRAAVEGLLNVTGGNQVEVEVESLEEVDAALDAGAGALLLDNMSLEAMTEAVALTASRARLEASGGVSLANVRAVAETGAILSPEKTVLIPDPNAGCSLAATVTAQQLREWKAEHPGAVVVSYVNTSAEVKAESDYCCTSGNARAVIEAIPADQEILFLPDFFLGLWLERVTGRKLRIWMGECHVHAGIHPADIERWHDEAPDAELLVHPECGCASQAMAFGDDRTRILSTEGMVDFAKKSPKKRFVVATEVGIIHRLAKEAPGKRFEPANPAAVCRYMKMITLEKLRDSLRDTKHVVSVPPDVASRARGAIERMVAIS